MNFANKALCIITLVLAIIVLSSRTRCMQPEWINGIRYEFCNGVCPDTLATQGYDWELPHGLDRIEMFFNPGYKRIVARDQQLTPVGVIAFMKNPQENDSCSIRQLAVHKRFRSSGIGSELFLQALDHMKNMLNCDVISWYSTRKGLDFYEKKGARVTDYNALKMKYEFK